MKTNNSFGCRFLSVFLCLSMLLAPIVTFADSINTRTTGQASAMSSDQAVTIRTETVLSTPIFKLVESEDEITDEDTYMFASSCTVGDIAKVLGYDTVPPNDTVQVADVGTFVSGQKTVFNIPEDIALESGAVISAGTYVAAPDDTGDTKAYEWYINNYANYAGESITPAAVYNASAFINTATVNANITRSLSADGSYAHFVHASGKDFGRITFNPIANLTDSESFLLIKYRTNAKTDGRAIGNKSYGCIYTKDQNLTTDVEWIGDENWHIMLADLSKPDGYNTNYPWKNRDLIYIDPVSDRGDAPAGFGTTSGYYIDFAYAAFFTSPEDALAYAAVNGDAEEASYTFEAANRENTYLGYNTSNLIMSDGVLEELVSSTKKTSTVTSYFAPTFTGLKFTWDRYSFLNNNYWDKSITPSNLTSQTMTVFGYSNSNFNINQTTYNDTNTPVYTYVKVMEAGETFPGKTAWLHTADGNVAKGVSGAVDTGAVLFVREGNSVYEVPVTLDMLYTTNGEQVTANNAGPVENLIVKYEGVDVNYEGGEFAVPFTLTVYETNPFFTNAGKVFRLLDSPTADNPSTLKNSNNNGEYTYYMFLEDNEKGYAKALTYETSTTETDTTNYTPSSKDVQVFELEIDGEKQCFVTTGDNKDYWELVEVTDEQQGTSGNRKYHYLMPETDFTFYQIRTGDNGAMLYYNLEGYSGNVDAKNRESTPSLVMDSWTWFYNGSNIRKTASMWAEIPADGYTPYGTGLGVYSLAYNKDYTGSPTEITVESDKTTREWRGLFYSHEHNAFGTRPENQEGSSIYTQGRTDVSVYDRVYYYEQCEDVEARVYIDKTDIAVAYGAAGADVTGASLVITTTMGDTVSVERVPITMDMLSTNGGTTALNTTDNPNSQREYQNVTVTYQDTAVGTFENVVIAADTDPSYPNPGSVIINKELDQATHNFFETGTARLELSVTGVPVSSGVDVVVCLDNSWSMENQVEGTKRRREIIKDALKAMLESFQEQNENGADIAVSVLTLDGYDLMNGQVLVGKGDASGVRNDTAVDSTSRGDYAQFISTGKNNVEIRNVENRFIEKGEITDQRISDILDSYYLTGSGTNYDRGLELTYETISDRQKTNALNGEKRESVVVFIGDGAPLQYNYIGFAASGGFAWAYLLTPEGAPDFATYEAEAELDQLGSTERDLFNTFYNSYSEHWVAEAIKGDTDRKYKIIDPDADPSDNYVDYVNGLGAKLYTIGVGLDYGDNSMFGTKDQIGQTHPETTVTEKITEAWVAKTEPLVAAVLNRISSNYSADTHSATQEPSKSAAEGGYCYSIEDNTAEVVSVFNTIAANVGTLGNAVYTDTMSEYVELETADIGEENVPASIKLIEYELYKFKEANTIVDGVFVSTEMIGTVKPGKEEGTLLEEVTFTTDANGNLTAAYSDKKGNTTNILANNKITAQYFTYDFNSETFKWNIGDIPENKYVLSFDVYLEGTMEGERSPGTYPTNSQAYLDYTNFEGEDRTIEVPTPYLTWGGASVSYGLYLVDANGNPVASLSGAATSFLNAYKVQDATLHAMFNYNSETGKITASDLPEGFTLYDPDAAYEVKANADNSGAWKITVGSGKKPSTYVTQYAAGSDAATNAQKVYTDLNAGDDFIAEGGFESKAGYTYSNTVVWFAVTSPIAASPETVVIDYGLPVNINITANDVGGFKATAITSQTLPVVTEYKGADITVYQSTEADYETDYKKYFDDSLTNGKETDGEEGAIGLYGKAVLTDDDFVKYTPTGMEMDGKDVFTYALQFENGTPSYAVGMDYLFRKLTVVPATSIYYEEEFVEFTTYNSDLVGGKKTQITPNRWENVSDIEGTSGSTNLDNNPQDQDRPGMDNTIVDVGNIYGYDEQYINCATFSLGNSKKITVDKNITGEATFTFKGTGFDIIGLTNHDTGTIIVDVYAGVPKIDTGSNLIDDTPVKSLLVDTYYGYTYAEKKDAENEVIGYEWVVNKDTSETLYQVPVISVEDLDYGKYTAVVTVAYSQYFDNRYDENGNNSYDFYFDAVRIYNPANNGANDSVIEDAYIKDKEGWPVYTELRGAIIEAKEIISSVDKEGKTLDGTMFIDGCPTIVKNATGYDQWVNVDYFHGRYTYERNQFDDNDNNDPSGAIKNYMNYGPNNEVYLAPGQAIAFTLDTDAHLKSYVAAVHIAMKAAKGEPMVNMYAVSPIDGGKYDFTDGLMEKTINSSTELYYNITALDGKTVVIMNSAEVNSDNILSITNIKRTFTQDPETVAKPEETSVVRTNSVYINRQTIELALASLEMESDSAATFEPDTFDVSVSKSSVKEGKTVTVTVKTSSDVDSITVNGETVTKYRRSLFTKQRTWTYTVKATEAGELPIEVVAYNADGEFSEPVTETVEVTSNSSTGGSSSSSWFDKWFGGLFGKK